VLLRDFSAFNRLALSIVEYVKLYFNLLYNKIKSYNVLPRNTYNIDKKGFIIGVVRRSK
jgi:hypothetical protein